MSFWKILGGAALGVGAISAAPFTGGGSLLGAATLASSLAGAGTIAAAVGAGAAGAAAGAYFDDDDDIREEGRRQGVREGKALSALNVDMMKARLEQSEQPYVDMLAMEAVAVATAFCDGHYCEDERLQIEEMLSGMSRNVLPEEILQKMHELYENPPNLPTAYEMARNSSLDIEFFDEIVDMVIAADEHEHENEVAFRQAWYQLRAA